MLPQDRIKPLCWKFLSDLNKTSREVEKRGSSLNKKMENTFFSYKITNFCAGLFFTAYFFLLEYNTKLIYNLMRKEFV